MKAKKAMPLLLSAIMAFGTAAVPLTANAAEYKTSVVSEQQTNLAAPIISKAESVYGGIKLSWEKVDGAEMYRVFYKSKNGWTKAVDTNLTSFLDESVLSGESYRYTVRCISADKKNFTSDYDVAGKTVTYVAAPEIAKTEVTYKSVKLSWNKVKGAEKYRVFRKGSSGWAKICDTTSVSATDNNVSADHKYTYTVRCISADAKRYTSGYNKNGAAVTTSKIPPIVLEKSSLTLDKGKTYTLKKTVADASKTVKWSSSNTAVATVNSNGKITAKSKGSTVITAEVDGVKAQCKVNVKVKKIYLSPSNQYANTYATGGTNEMAQCDKIAAATAKALERCGFDVMVAKSGTLMQTRCPESDKFGADIHMPIHTNASVNGGYTGGTRVFCYNASGRKAAQAVCDTLGAISPGKDDRVSYNPGLYEINRPNALSVYVECEFHDTVTGANWIRSNINEIGEAICKGMCNYFDYTYVPSSLATPKITKAESVYGGVKLSWNKVSGAEEYRIFRKNGSSWTKVADTDSNSYLDKNVSSGKSYTYTVRCISTNGKQYLSGYSKTGKSVKYVAAPKISKAESIDKSVKLSWSKVSGAEKYRVFVKNGSRWKALKDTTATSFTDNSVNYSETYTYTVRCINSAANSFTSGYDPNGVLVKTPAQPTKHTHSWQNITSQTKVKVVDEEAYTYEEPVYEEQERAICNDCGADITDNLEHIFNCPEKHDDKASYKVESIKVKVDTKIINVPEKSHYETKTEVVGRKCTGCGKVEKY